MSRLSLGGIPATQEQLDLYYTNAFFKQMVDDFCVRVATVYLKGAEEMAKGKQEEINAVIEASMKAPEFPAHG